MLKNNELLKITSYVFIWRIYMSLMINISSIFVNLQNNFLGGGKEVFLKAPWFYSMANFDGEHYISIAQNGYKPLQYFFFPFYPFLIKFFVNLLANNIYFNYVLIGQFLSLICFITALYFLKKLYNFSLLFFLFFPTSFYFAAVYTESLFLLVSALFFYFLHKKNYFVASLFAIIGGLTRLVGAIFPLLLLIELTLNYRKNNKVSVKYLFYLFISSLGTLSYLVYLKIKTNDFLEFLHNVSIYGDQRSSKFIFLPQVYYRYIVKIIPNLFPIYFPFAYVVILEFIVSLVFLFSLFLVYKKYSLNFFIFSCFLFLIPTLSGSFSSLPRYVLPIFPVFLLFSEYFNKLNFYKKIAISIILVIMFNISLMFFANGYWIS